MPDDPPLPDSGETPDASPDADGATPDGGAVDGGTGPLNLPGAPRLLNFRVAAAASDRVYFDSSETITATTFAGFIVSNRMVVGITINGDRTAGHYLTVSSEFTFWDNNTVRYEGGSDLTDADGNALYLFNLRYVDNPMPEPEPTYATPYYVRTTGSDGNSGLSHAEAFRTMGKAVSMSAKIIYVEVGEYVGENVVFGYDGTFTEPILVQGYQTLTGGVPDPIAPNYWQWGEHGSLGALTLDARELPAFDGGDRTDGKGFALSNFMVLRNLQFTNYRVGIDVRVRHHVIIDNFVGVAFGETSVSASGKAIAAGGANGRPAEHCRYRNITISDVSGASFRHYGNLSLLDNVRIYNDAGNGDAFSHPDYYISMYECSNNIIRNCLVDKIGDFPGSAHGISLKGSGIVSEYNLIESSTAINQREGIELRHREVRYNTVRNVDIYRRPGDRGAGGGVVARDEASFNTIEDSTIHNVYRPIYFYDQIGEQGAQVPAHDNTFRNIVIYDSPNVFASGGSLSTGATSYNNRFINLTVHDCEAFSDCNWLVDDTNIIENSTFSVIGRFERLPAKPDPLFTFVNCNFFDLGYAVPTGTDIVENDPLFTDPDNGDFHLMATSPIRDSGSDTVDLHYDIDGLERFPGGYSIGAFEQD